MKISQRDSIRVRGKILFHLYMFFESQSDQSATQTCEQISLVSGISLGKVLLYHEILVKDEEITCDGNGAGWIHNMSITKKGRFALLEGKYQSMEAAYSWGRLFIVTRVIVPIASFVLSIAAFGISIYNLLQ